jgi:hypothetical protein
MEKVEKDIMMKQVEIEYPNIVGDSGQFTIKQRLAILDPDGHDPERV